MKLRTSAFALACGLAAAPAFAQTSSPTEPALPDLSTLPAVGQQQLPGLVTVNLENIRAEIAKDLDIDLQNVPISILLPVAVAANVCGVDVGALGGGQIGSDSPECSATNTTIATQYVTNTQTATGDAAGAEAGNGDGSATEPTDPAATEEAPAASEDPTQAGETATPAEGEAATDATAEPDTGTEPDTTGEGPAEEGAASADTSGDASSEEPAPSN